MEVSETKRLKTPVTETAELKKVLPEQVLAASQVVNLSSFVKRPV